jgi:hypothetical protein
VRGWSDCDPRVGTWNVEYARGVEKNRARLALLAGWEADVWVLTETHGDLDLSATHTAIRSCQRYQKPGGRWTTIWTSLPVLECLETVDPNRCVAARLDGGDAGEILVYGTVLPWNGDVGPDQDRPARDGTSSTASSLGRVRSGQRCKSDFPTPPWSSQETSTMTWAAGISTAPAEVGHSSWPSSLEQDSPV